MILLSGDDSDTPGWAAQVLVFPLEDRSGNSLLKLSHFFYALKLRSQFGQHQLSNFKLRNSQLPRLSRIFNNWANTPENGPNSVQSQFGQKCDSNSARNTCGIGPGFGSISQGIN